MARKKLYKSHCPTYSTFTFNVYIIPAAAISQSPKPQSSHSVYSRKKTRVPTRAHDLSQILGICSMQPIWGREGRKRRRAPKEVPGYSPGPTFRSCWTSFGPTRDWKFRVAILGKVIAHPSKWEGGKSLISASRQDYFTFFFYTPHVFWKKNCFDENLTELHHF